MVNALAAFCEQHLDSTLELLRVMVAINSFTENAAGVNRLGEATAAAFAPLGFKPSFHPATQPLYGKHLVLRRSAGVGAPTVALISHLDTVFTEEEEERNDFRWRREGSRIYGPGTNDIKGGTALIHLVLSALAAESPGTFESVNWVVLFNACEEVISEDFGALCRAQLPADTLGCLVFEADGGAADRCSLVTARKGRATFTVDVEGRASHAGSSHRQGANAVVELAGVVTRLSALTDYSNHLTVNVGSVAGGTVANRVPHSACARLEMRAFDPAIYAQAKARILACAGEGAVCSVNEPRLCCEVHVLCDHETGPWPRNAATDQLLAIWREAGRELGSEIAHEERGGLSDGNVLWDAFPTLDGLGPCGENSHCSEQTGDGRKAQEWVDADSFVPKAVLNARAILKLLEAQRARAARP